LKMWVVALVLLSPILSLPTPPGADTRLESTQGPAFPKFSLTLLTSKQPTEKTTVPVPMVEIHPNTPDFPKKVESAPRQVSEPLVPTNMDPIKEPHHSDTGNQHLIEPMTQIPVVPRPPAPLQQAVQTTLPDFGTKEGATGNPLHALFSGDADKHPGAMDYFMRIPLVLQMMAQNNNPADQMEFIRGQFDQFVRHEGRTDVYNLQTKAGNGGSSCFESSSSSSDASSFSSEASSWSSDSSSSIGKSSGSSSDSSAQSSESSSSSDSASLTPDSVSSSSSGYLVSSGVSGGVVEQMGGMPEAP